MHNEQSKLKALIEIAAIDITLEFEQILEKILEIACKTIHAHSGTMMLVDEETDELKMVSSYGLPHNYIEMVYEAAEKSGVPITSSPSGTVLKTGKYYLVPNIFEEPKDKPWYGISREFGFSSQLFSPMKRGLKVIGLLNVYWGKPHQFLDEEISFLSIAASQASSVVQNAKMCRRMRENIEELDDYKKHLEDRIKETSQKLFDSELYLRKIVQSSFDGIFVIDEKGIIEYGNDAFFKILGWDKNELIGEFFMKVIPEHLHEFMLERWNEIQNGIEIPYETKIITNQGETRYMYVSHSRTKIKESTKYVIVIKDISEYKKLINQLKKSERKYRELFDNAQDPMYTHDLQGVIISMNEIGYKLLGCSSREEVVGTHFSRWLTPESFEYAQKTLIQHISGELVEQPIVLEVIAKNGEHKWAEIRNRPIMDGDTITGIHGIARDITEKVMLEQALLDSHEELRESENKYRELFENAYEGIYTHDDKGIFTDINCAGLDVLGCQKEEVVGEHFSKWLTPQSLKTAENAMSKSTKGEKVQMPLFLEIVRKDGEQRWLEFDSRPVFKDTEFSGISGIFRDITEKMNLEKQLDQYHEQLEASYEKLMEADKLKTEFISNITHELLTPLTAIKGFTELIRDGTLGNINTEQKRSLEIIFRNSERLNILINNLLQATNLEKGLIKLEKKQVSINNVISKAVDDIQTQADAKQMRIKKNTGNVPEITADEEKLYEVIVNLLVNAIKFTPDKGLITISSSREREKIHISVSDTGIGIPPEKLSRIFDRFYQLDGSDSRKYGGSGIGLSLCKSIVEKHNGFIWAESNGKKGSTFHIMLPLSID